MSATSILINLDNLNNNLQVIRTKIGEKMKVMAIVKSNAYGHGAVEVSKYLANQGVDYLAVTNLPEALELRLAGIKIPILIIALIDFDEYCQCLQNDIMLTVCSYQQLEQLEKFAEEAKIKAKVVLKVDTGMNRIGIKYSEAANYANYILQCNNIELKGVTTHLASADAGFNEFTQQQLEKFKQAVAQISQVIDSIEIISIANSAGIFVLEPLYGNTVRAGIALYGLKPDENIPVDLSALKPVLSFKSKVLFIKEIESLEKIGYSGTFTAQNSTYIATIPVGYAEGYPRNLSNKAVVLIKNKMYPIVGNICMSTLMVDLGLNKAEIAVGDEVQLIGGNNLEQITVDYLAKQAGLINYELVCGLKGNLKREYISEL